MLKHNKKRNVGLLNEFFAQYMANAAVEFRFEDYSKAELLWKSHFKQGSELSKELGLFETISNANLSDRNVAYDLLKKIKKHVKEQSQEKLDREKTTLIHEIRNQLCDESFFDRQIDDYKSNATIQLVMNSWRNNDDENANSFSHVSQLEEKVVDYMVSEKKELPPLDTSLLNTNQDDIDRLIVNVFREKVDNKYSGHLNEDQKEILGLYTFANNSMESRKSLSQKLDSVKENVLQYIDKELSDQKENTPTGKLNEVRTCLTDKSYNTENPDEKTITFYLSVCTLKHELESE